MFAKDNLDSGLSLSAFLYFLILIIDKITFLKIYEGDPIYRI